MPGMARHTVSLNMPALCLGGKWLGVVGVGLVTSQEEASSNTMKGQTKWEGVGLLASRSRFELSRAWGFDDPPNCPE